MIRNLQKTLIPWLAIAAMAMAFASCHSARNATSTTTTPTVPPMPAQPITFGDNEGSQLWQEMAGKLTDEAYTWLGTPYQYGAQDKGEGTDCSGLTMKVYQEAMGIQIPRNSAKQAEYCTPVKPEDIRPGDLVFFNPSGAGIGHVGLFIGDGKMIHASGSRGVVVSNLADNYYQRTYHSAGRVPDFEQIVGKGKRNIQPVPRPEPTYEPATLPEAKPQQQVAAKAVVPTPSSPYIARARVKPRRATAAQPTTLQLIEAIQEELPSDAQPAPATTQPAQHKRAMSPADAFAK